MYQRRRPERSVAQQVVPVITDFDTVTMFCGGWRDGALHVLSAAQRGVMKVCDLDRGFYIYNYEQNEKHGECGAGRRCSCEVD